MDDGYDITAGITGFIAFVAIWWYCAATYGFLGFALGWMPAVILAAAIGMLWPLVLIAAVLLAFFLLK